MFLKKSVSRSTISKKYFLGKKQFQKMLVFQNKMLKIMLGPKS